MDGYSGILISHRSISALLPVPLLLAPVVRGSEANRNEIMVSWLRYRIPSKRQGLELVMNHGSRTNNGKALLPYLGHPTPTFGPFPLVHTP